MDGENRVIRESAETDDDLLYQRYLDGDMKAGDALMLRYSDMLTAYLNSHLDNIHDAEDLMLETFSVILVNKPRIRTGCFRAYLFKIARNKANRLWKKSSGKTSLHWMRISPQLSLLRTRSRRRDYNLMSGMRRSGAV